MKSLMTLAWVTALTLTLISCGSSHAGMGPLDGIITEEQGQSWKVAPAGEGWRLSNTQDPGAIRYYYASEQAGQGGRRSISVEVRVNGGPDSLAGILYAFQDQPRSYYLFTLAGDSSVHLHHFNQGSFEQKMQLGLDGLGNTATLTVHEYGSEIALLVNGEEKSRIGNSDMGRGAVGVVAVHTGDFLMQNFDVSLGDQSFAPRVSAAEAPAQQNVASEAVRSHPVSGDSLRLKRVELKDPHHPQGADYVFSTMIPADWQTEGGVNWSTMNGCLKMPQITWAAHSPDKQHAVAMLPNYSWGWTNGNYAPTGCVQANIQDAEQAVRYLLQNAPNLRYKVMDVIRPPELQPIKAMLDQQMQMSQPIGRQWADLAVLKVRSDDGEVRSDSYLLAITTHWQNSTPDGWGMGGTIDAGGGYLAMLIAMSTEQGKLDQGHPALPTILGSMQWNQRWQDKTNQFLHRGRVRDHQERQKLFDMSQVTARTNSSLLDSAHESFMRRSAMNDRGHAESVEAVWNTETYSTPEGDRSFSAMYDHAWRLNNGDYVLTNDASYQPFRDSGIDGERLQVNR